MEGMNQTGYIVCSYGSFKMKPPCYYYVIRRSLKKEVKEKIFSYSVLIQENVKCFVSTEVSLIYLS
jgi:hypothetical protein